MFKPPFLGTPLVPLKTKAAHSERWPTVTRDTVYAHVDAIFPDSLKYSMHLILTDIRGNHYVFFKSGA